MRLPRAPLPSSSSSTALRPFESLRIVELALDVPRRLQHAVAERPIDDVLAVVVVDRLAHQVAELIVGQLLAAVADQRGAERQHAVAAEVVERRDELAVGEVAGDAEHDEAAGIRVALAAERRGRPGGVRRPPTRTPSSSPWSVSS